MSVIDWYPIVLAAAESAPKQPALTDFLPFLVMIILAFYFLIIRPQKREQQQKQQMIATLERGDRVVTIGGIHGEVAGIDQTKQTVTIDVGRNVKIEFSRSAVSTVVEKKKKKTGEESPKE